MAFRNLIIQSRAFVRSSNNKIKLKNSDEKELELPFEDLGTIIIDSPDVTITSSVFEKIATNNSALFFTDKSHLPIGVFLSFNNHSHQLKQLNKQIRLTESFKGKLWQSIIKSKITNQSKVLELFDIKKESLALKTLSQKVQLSDKTNKESYASNVYFRALFGEKFTRSSLCTTNSALNYGFSIIRGNIARFITAYGLIPALGVHHKNEYNNFNLADDLIEPYRPFVEYFVKMYIKEIYTPILSITDRNSLTDILNMEVSFGGKRFSLETSIEQMVKSLITSLNSNNPIDLITPNIKAIKRKFYE